MIIKNGKIALPGRNDLASLDIEIDQGKIVCIGENLQGPDCLDASGLQVFPGAIDPHVHFNEPGYTDREDFYHGSCAAASGGVTTVIDMPCTSVPPVTSLENFREKLKAVKDRSLIDFAFFGGVSGQSYAAGYEAAMTDLAPFVAGFKTYFISGMPGFHRLTPDRLTRVLEAAKRCGRPVLLHAEDYDIVTEKTREQSAEGDAWINYYRSRPECAETEAVRKALASARQTGAQLHIVHIGTGEAALLLKDEANVSGETAPHYLEFSFRDFEELKGSLKTTPVVKSPGESEILWKCLEEGLLDFAASDHAPAPAAQKNTGSVWTDYSGIPGSGTLFPYLYSEGFVKRRIPPARFLKIVSENAAKRYGFWDRKGSIETGKDADLVLVDPNRTWQIKGREFLSKGKITPFENSVLKGRVSKTLVRGTVVYDVFRGIVERPGYGQFLKPHFSGERA